MNKNHHFTDRWSQWATGIQYEIDFWDRWVERKGAPWTDDFNKRVDENTQVDDLLEDVISSLQLDSVKILDVGAGPLTCIGKVSKNGIVNITAVDPLADFYEKILHRYDLKVPIKSSFGLAEDLSLFFPKNSFDIVHCQNALDHSIEPVRCLLQMLEVCRVGGYVMLRHAHNEAENENYEGFHKWNLTNRGDDVVIWNKNEEISTAEMFNGFARCSIILSDGYLINTFKKISEVPQNNLEDDKYRFGSLLRKFISHLGSADK